MATQPANNISTRYNFYMLTRDFLELYSSAYVIIAGSGASQSRVTARNASFDPLEVKEEVTIGSLVTLQSKL